MTLSEFKCWLEGYECSFDNGRPTLEQWEKVKAKLGSIGWAEPASPPLSHPAPHLGPVVVKPLGWAGGGDFVEKRIERQIAEAPSFIRGGMIGHAKGAVAEELAYIDSGTTVRRGDGS